jgi:hypothetical protein
MGGIPDFSMGVYGSVWTTRGQNIGRTTGTRMTTFISITRMTDITSTSGGIPEIASPLASTKIDSDSQTVCSAVA